MTSLSLVLNDSHTRTILKVFDMGSYKSLYPLPMSLIFPFENYNLIDGDWLSTKLYQDRLQRAKDTRITSVSLNDMSADDNQTLDEYKESDHFDNGELKENVSDEDDYDFAYEVGLLDKWDVEYLQANSSLSINAAQSLTYIRNWLNDILSFQPHWSELGEQWYANLERYIKSLDESAEFQLDIGCLFMEGQVYERVMSHRFTNEDFYEGVKLTADTITGRTKLPDAWIDWHRDMQHQLDLLTTLNRKVENTISEEVPVQVKLMNQLRAYALRGEWTKFINQMDPKSIAQLDLMSSCYVVATELSNTIEQTDSMRLKRNLLWIDSDSDQYYRKAFGDFRSWMNERFADEAYDKAFQLAELIFDKFPLGVNDPRLVKRLYANLYLDLSYYYVVQGLPRKTFDMLLPIIEKMDTDEDWQQINADTRARLRANFEASQVHMRDNGEVLPDNVTLFRQLTKADEDWIDEKDELYDELISQRKPQQALDIALEVQQLLDKKEIAKDGYRYLYWQIEKARALRNLGHYADAITVLTNVIKTGELKEHTHSKQQLPRAKLALAICYNRQNHPDEAKAIYEAMTRDRYCLEDNAVMCGVYGNLAEIVSNKQLFEDAYEHYLKSENCANEAGFTALACERAWLAFREAKKANDGLRQKEILQHIIDDYAMTADENIQKIVGNARNLLSLTQSNDREDKVRKSGGFLSRLFGGK